MFWKSHSCISSATGRKLLDDGRSVVVIEGVERFYLEEILSEKPYIKARVQPFQDYSENSDVLDQLEQAVFDEVRTNVQVCELTPSLI